MVDKLHEYEGTVGQLHRFRENVKEKVADWKEYNAGLKGKLIENVFGGKPERDDVQNDIIDYDLSYITRRKTRWELIRLCVVVMGIEFAYAAITAFSSPILLEIGLEANIASMVFSLSPILGFFLSPITGSLSDRCTFRFGRRRIFILGYAFFEVLGLLLLPHGISNENSKNKVLTFLNYTSSLQNQSFDSSSIMQNSHSENIYTSMIGKSLSKVSPIIFVLTVIAIVIADFNADSLQNPSRAYLLDVCCEEDHTRGLSTFTVCAGTGGTIGYLMGSINWNNLYIGRVFGGNIRTTFYLTTAIFITCVLVTVTTFPEIPLEVFHRIQWKKSQEISSSAQNKHDNNFQKTELGNMIELEEVEKDECNYSKEKFNGFSYGRRRSTIITTNQEEIPTLGEYLKSILNLPYSLKILLLTNVLCWMSHVSYSLYFTDYVGQEIFGGEPQAPLGSPSRLIYDEGVRYACLGMMVYSFSCLLCSLFLEKAISKFGLRLVYITNLLLDGLSMFLMFYFNNNASVIFFSFASGIIYCTLFTVPYVIVARYHTLGVFAVDREGNFIPASQVRGLGTDVSIIGSSVFIAQFFLSLGMGSFIKLYGSTAAVPLSCSILAFLAAISAKFVIYLDL